MAEPEKITYTLKVEGAQALADAIEALRNAINGIQFTTEVKKENNEQ